MFVVVEKPLSMAEPLRAAADVGGAKSTKALSHSFFRLRKFLKLGAEGLFEPHNHFFVRGRIDDADEIVFAAERELQGNGNARRDAGENGGG